MTLSDLASLGSFVSGCYPVYSLETDAASMVKGLLPIPGTPIQVSQETVVKEPHYPGDDQ